MKTYEKPTIALVSLSDNTTFCSSACGIDVEGENGDHNYDDVILLPGAFGPGESCDFDVEWYCKFTSSGESIIRPWNS